MNIGLIVGGALICAALGATVSVVMRERAAPTAAAPAAAAAPPGETVVTRTIAGTSLRVPLPEGYCVLDPNDPQDRRALARPGRFGNQRVMEIVAVAVPCDRRRAIDAPISPPGFRILLIAAHKPNGRSVERVSTPRPQFLARLKRESDWYVGENVRQTDLPGGASMTLRQAGDDANAVYLRTSIGNARVTRAEVCAAVAGTVAARIWLMLMVLENCSTAPMDDEMLPQAAQLAGRIVALNP